MTPGETPPRESLKPSTLLLIGALAFLPYLFLPSLPIHSDSVRAIVDNKAVQQAPLADIFTVDFWGAPLNVDWGTRSYRPLVSLSYALEVRALGTPPKGDPTTPRVLHVTDMLIHAGGAILFALLLLELRLDHRVVLPASALFAVHPVLTESVCSIVGRADLMASVAMLGALVLHLRAGSARQPWLFEGGALALLAASLLCKEYAVAFPMLFVAIDLALRISGRSSVCDWRRHLRVWGLAFALLLAYLAFRYSVMGALGGVPMLGEGDHPLFNASLPVRWANAAWLLLVALRLLLAPVALNYFYGAGTIPLASGFLDPKVIGAIVLFAILTGIALRALLHRGQPLPVIGLALFLLPLGPALNTVSLAGVLFAERYLYLPLAGLMIVVALVLEPLVKKERFRVAALSFAGVAVLVLGAMTFRRVEDWRSTEALARASLKWYPRGANSLFELGLSLGNQGNDKQAAEMFRASIDVEPRRPQVWKNLAAALMNTGEFREAANAWRRSIDLSAPDIGRLWLGLGEAELLSGRFDEAVRALRRAHDLMPQDERTTVKLANAMLRLAQREVIEGRGTSGIELARQALATSDLPPDGLFLAGLVLARGGAGNEARALFDRAEKQDPEMLRAKFETAVQLDEGGKRDDAIALYREILLARPDHVASLFNLGRSLFLAGRPEEAATYLRAGLSLRNDPKARDLLVKAESASSVANR